MIIACVGWQKAVAQNPADSRAALVQDFENRVAEYAKLRKKAEAELPKLRKPTDSPEKIH